MVTHPLCWRCGENPATEVFGDFMTVNHGGGQNWCKRCVVEVQTKHARERTAVLADLEAQLVKLGGPAKREICGPVRWTLPGDTAEWGALCTKTRGHKGKHQVTP